MRVDPLAFAVVILPTLWAAHNVGDHLAQTDHQAARKASSWSAMAGHVSSYQAVQAVAVEAVLAAGAGRCANCWNTRGHRGSSSRAPINGPYQADQACHHGCLLVTALIMSVSRRP